MQKKRTNTAIQESFRNFSGLDPSFSQTHIPTTQYPHQRSTSPDAFNDQFGTSHSTINPYLLSTRLSSNQLSNIDPTTGAMHLTGQLPRQCEVHMNSYQQVYGMNAAGLEGAAGNGGSNQNLKFRSSSHQLLQQAKVTVPQAILQVLFYCCRANGLLAKFPSRAKRIDVLSRFIFPLIFAIFNLAYWLYYLLAKNNFSGNSNLA